MPQFFLKRIFVICCSLTAFLFISGFSKSFKIEGDKGEVVNIIFSEEFLSNGKKIRTMSYFDNDKLIAQSKETFLPNDRIEKYEKREMICGREDTVIISQPEILLDSKEEWNSERKTSTLPFPGGNVTIGSGVVNDIRINVDILRNGGQLDLKVVVPEKTDWFNIRVTGWEEIFFREKPAIKITIEPASSILRFFVKSSYLIIEKERPYAPLALKGIFIPIKGSCKPITGTLFF